ncbi:MAG TPA: hypothetical protein VFU68_02425, partial [Terracidiphilus sp.]|nr:hypothetical protein [Terracidiphilus sp.]
MSTLKAARKARKFRAPRNCIAPVVALVLACIPSLGAAQQQPAKKPAPGPMLTAGVEALDTPQFTLKLVRSSQTVAALLPKGADGFDFTPGDRLVERSQNGY